MANRKDWLPPADEDGKTTVLEVFGMKLSVKNRRLAEVLTMDAAEALGLETRSSRSDKGESASTGVDAPVVPDTPLEEPDNYEELLANRRAELRGRAEAAGRALGFETAARGTWVSPFGPLVHVRVADRELSDSDASDIVRKVADLVVSRGGAGESALLVTVSDISAERCARAVTRQRLAGAIRVASIDRLESLPRQSFLGEVDHRRALVLLVPQEAVDVGQTARIFAAGMVQGHTELPEP